MIYGFYIFHGDSCVYQKDFRETPAEVDLKLIHGLLDSIEGLSPIIAQACHTSDPVEPEFNSLQTPLYRINQLKTLTGYRLVLISRPSLPDLREELRYLYTHFFLTAQKTQNFELLADELEDRFGNLRE